MEAINESDNPAQNRLLIFVEQLQDVGITPNFVLETEEPNANVLGVYLTIETDGQSIDSAVLPTNVPLRVA